MFVKKARKTIGVILSLADGDYQNKLIEGIQTRAYALDYDVLVFSSFIKEGSSPEWQSGEKNIYNMINYSMLDALIIAPDTMQLEGCLEKVVADIKKKFKGPAVSVELELEGFHSIFSDDVKPIKKLVSHLIEEHNFTDIAFVTGFKEHPHSQKRLEGYCEALVEHGLAIDKERVFYGDFWYSCGERVVNEMLSTGRPLPQAIACASDTTAIGICEELKKRGIKVPEDVAVIGYDSIPAGINYYPCITSAVIPSQNTGAQAVDYINAKLLGKSLSPSKNLSVEISVGQSCGCGVSLAEKQNILTQKWRDTDVTKDFNAVNNNMLENLLSESDLHSYLTTLGWFTYQIGTFDNFALCLCENWDGLSGNISDNEYIKEGYTEKMIFAIERGQSHEHHRVNTDRYFPLSDMQPILNYRRDYPTTYFFTPVHFNDRCFGYSVVSYGREVRSYDATYRMWIRFVNGSLESLRRQTKLELMYRHMRESAVIDSMTGIYNRNGFNLYADEIFRSAAENNKKMLVVLGDLNGLKFINDTFGHFDGDVAIKAAARAISSVCGQDKRCFRIGGDEFIILSTGEYTHEEIDSLIESIHAHLEADAIRLKRNYPLSISLGVFYDTTIGMSSIEVPISIADERMFREKERSKLKRK